MNLWPGQHQLVAWLLHSPVNLRWRNKKRNVFKPHVPERMMSVNRLAKGRESGRNLELQHLRLSIVVHFMVLAFPV
jgi:hypothetical protein